MNILTFRFKKYIWVLLIILIITSIFINIIINKKEESDYSEQLTFAHITDTHFSDATVPWHNRVLPYGTELLDEAIDKINENNDVEFVIFTGDLLDASNKKLLKEVIPHLNLLKKTWYYSFGNHDKCHGERIPPKEFLTELSKSNKNINADKPYYSLSPKDGFKIIILDTISCKHIESMGKINQKQYNWLINEFNNSKNDVVMVFSHIPVEPPYYDPHHSMKNPDMIKQIVKKRKAPTIFLSGHYHGARIYQNGNILYVSTPALISYPNAFRFVTVTKIKDKVHVKIKEEQTNDKNILKISRKINKTPNIVAGTKRDQSGTYTLKYKE